MKKKPLTAACAAVLMLSLICLSACGNQTAAAAAPTGSPAPSAAADVGSAGWARVSLKTDPAAGQITGDSIYNTGTMSGVASVSDLVLTGYFSEVRAFVRDRHIRTSGTFHVEQALIGACDPVITVEMAGGTIPFQDIDQLYDRDQLEKMRLDPEHPSRETYSMSFMGMPIFETGKTYLLTVVAQADDPAYVLMPSPFSLCELAGEPAGGAVRLNVFEVEKDPPAESAALDGRVFSIDEYLKIFEETPKLER